MRVTKKEPNIQEHHFLLEEQMVWKVSKNREVVKKEKQIHFPTNKENLNHKDSSNHIYLKLIHTQMQAFQRWWAHTCILIFGCWNWNVLKWLLDRGFSEEQCQPHLESMPLPNSASPLSPIASVGCPTWRKSSPVVSLFPWRLKVFMTLGVSRS